MHQVECALASVCVSCVVVVQDHFQELDLLFELYFPVSDLDGGVVGLVDFTEDNSDCFFCGDTEFPFHAPFLILLGGILNLLGEDIQISSGFSDCTVVGKY